MGSFNTDLHSIAAINLVGQDHFASDFGNNFGTAPKATTGFEPVYEALQASA